ncbi:MAG: DUF1295 domain-containing protein [Bacteroidales bacterium]|nr:DUF1295 domain-containing protein [Bacteroidales bacterium]MBN2757069.1 DUF1295 domain-containing protein [Bacteroidales bacterium]HES59587.1 DUF1295 domain-containing protein [Caldithrix sp.]
MQALYNDYFFGIIVLSLFSLQGIVMIFSKGSIRLEKPNGGIISWFYNILNLSIIMIITPIVAFSLFGKINISVFLISINFNSETFNQNLSFFGLILFAIGSLIMFWSRITIWDNFRLGAVEPKGNDKLIQKGLYKIIRHPTYLSVIINAFGLSFLSKSAIILILTICIIYLIIKIIPIEEILLKGFYKNEFNDYKKSTKKLIPFIY